MYGVDKLTSFLDKSELSRSDVAGPEEFKSPSSSSSSSKFTQSDQKLAQLSKTFKHKLN